MEPPASTRSRSPAISRSTRVRAWNALWRAWWATGRTGWRFTANEHRNASCAEPHGRAEPGHIAVPGTSLEGAHQQVADQYRDDHVEDHVGDQRDERGYVEPGVLPAPSEAGKGPYQRVGHRADSHHQRMEW